MLFSLEGRGCQRGIVSGVGRLIDRDQSMRDTRFVVIARLDLAVG